MKKVIECSHAIAEAVKLCKPLVIPMYPITPQTHIVEKLADAINDGKLDSEMIHVESEHSAISAAVGSSATGVRTFTATSSQGLALMHEILFIASELRTPIVMAVANRALSGPINIWSDHSDAMAQRDTGWIQLYCESSQEAYDTTIQAFKIAEKVGLPTMVCVDGFTLSHVYEPVEFIGKNVKKFLPDYTAKVKLDVDNPVTMGPVGFPSHYMEFRQELHKELLDSKRTIKNVNKEFSDMFGRGYGDGLIETYKMKDAKKAILCMGSICGTARIFIDEMRKKKVPIGMIKLKCFRPFPKDELIKVTKNLKELIVIDRAVSLGNEGVIAPEVKSVLSNLKIKGFIAGLGGRDVTIEHFHKALNDDSGWLN